MLLLEILGSLAIARRSIFLTIFTNFILISLEFFAMIVDVRILAVFKKKSVVFRKNMGI